MFLFIAVNDAEKTVFPNPEPPRLPKASPGQMTRRGRGKGEFTAGAKHFQETFRTTLKFQSV